jgi:FtsP/CotA-like multicopper oxidase with cupredoxin domain
MFGALVVDPRTGPAKGVHEMIQVLSSYQGSYLINGKSFPATDTYSFRQGAKVLIRTINMDTMMNHPMHLHGFSFREVGANGGTIPRRLQYAMYEQDVAPGETYDMLFTANHTGVWLYHCHVLAHVTGPNGEDAGMITVFKVR